MNILITGVGGFIGTYLSKKLSEDFNVIGIIRSKNKKELFDSNSKIKTYAIDLSQPFEIDDKIDVIIHAAARSLNPATSINHYVYDNIISTQNLIEFAKRKKVKLFVYLSAISVFGSINSKLVNEQTAIINPCPYGISKYLGELLLKENEDKLISVSFRMPVVVGNDMNNGWLFNIYHKIKNGENITIYNPNSPYNMIHVSDIYELIKSCINKNISGSNLFTISCDNLLSINEIVVSIIEKLESKSQIEVKSSEDIGFKISNKRTKKILGFKPQKAYHILEELLNK